MKLERMIPIGIILTLVVAAIIGGLTIGDGKTPELKAPAHRMQPPAAKSIEITGTINVGLE